MELIGKCKEDFKLYFIKKYATHYFGQWSRTDIDFFYSLPDSFKWGVLVDFFDSLGMSVEAYNKKHCDLNFYESCNDGYLGIWKTRNEARTEAIKKANEIYNEKEFVFPNDLDELKKPSH